MADGNQQEIKISDLLICEAGELILFFSTRNLNLRKDFCYSSTLCLVERNQHCSKPSSHHSSILFGQDCQIQHSLGDPCKHCCDSARGNTQGTLKCCSYR